MLKVPQFCALALAALALSVTGANAMEDDMVLNRKGDAASQQLNLNAAAASKNAPQDALSSQSSSNVRLAGLFFVLFGACGGAAVLYYKRRRGTAVSAGATPKLSIVERLPFGPNREFVLLKACDRLLVVAAHGNQIVCLTDMATDLAPVAAAAEAPVQDFNEKAPLSYESLFSQVRKRAAGEVSAAPVVPTAPAAHARAKAPVAPQEDAWPDLEGAKA